MLLGRIADCGLSTCKEEYRMLFAERKLRKQEQMSDAVSDYYD